MSGGDEMRGDCEHDRDDAHADERSTHDGQMTATAT